MTIGHSVPVYRVDSQDGIDIAVYIWMYVGVCVSMEDEC